MATTPVYGWRTPDGPVQADGPGALATLAADIETTLTAAQWQSYTPVWATTGSGAVQPNNGGALRVGRYRVAQGWCDFSAYIAFGASTNGGRGQCTVSLPVPCSSALDDQVVRAKLWVPTYARWDGLAVLGPGGGNTSVCYPMFNAQVNNTTVAYWTNNDATGASGTGIPQIPGHWTAENGGNVAVSGRYLVA